MFITKHALHQLNIILTPNQFAKQYNIILILLHLVKGGERQKLQKKCFASVYQKI